MGGPRARSRGGRDVGRRKLRVGLAALQSHCRSSAAVRATTFRKRNDRRVAVGVLLLQESEAVGSRRSPGNGRVGTEKSKLGACPLANYELRGQRGESLRQRDGW